MFTVSVSSQRLTSPFFFEKRVMIVDQTQTSMVFKFLEIKQGFDNIYLPF